MLINHPQAAISGRLRHAHTMIEVGHKRRANKIRTRLAELPGPNDGIDSSPGDLLDIRDGSLIWGSKGNAVRGGFPNAAAAPATVSGESFVTCHWESRSWEGGEG